MKSSQKQFGIVLGIFLAGVVMRAPFTVIPAILTDIAAGLQVPVSSLGLLTSLPLLMFAACSVMAPKWAEKVGLERLVILGLLVMTVGSLLRVINVPALYVGTLMIGVAISVINVLLPSLVTKHFPRRVGLYTTLYITAMGVASTIASMVAAPIVAVASWKGFLLCVSALVALAALIWLPNWRYRPEKVSTRATGSALSLLKNPYVLIFLVFGGLQSMLFYTELTWLPTMAQTAGLSKSQAGFLAGMNSLISIPVSMVLPSILSRLSKEKRSLLMLFLTAISLVGLGLLALKPVGMASWLLINCLLSLSISSLFPYMMLLFSFKTSSSQQTACLSGLVQSGGYLLASVGPVALGYSYQAFGSWMPLIASLFLVTLIVMGTIFLLEKKDTIL